MILRWFGYGCFSFSNDKVTIVFDPHDGKSIGLFSPNTYADYAFCTHNSFDRNCFGILHGNHKDFFGLKEKMKLAEGVTVESFDTTAVYDNVINSSYLLTMDKISIAILGCISSVPPEEDIKKLSKANIVIVPIGEYTTMPIKEINRLLDMIKVPIIIPSEFKSGGITLPLQNIHDFIEGKDNSSITYLGNEAEFVLEDIVDYSGIWIFDI